MRTWAEIDTACWRHNFRLLSDVVRPAELLPVVKANAYGLGDRETAEALQQAGARCLAVSCLNEGLRLRDTGLDIIVLGASLPDELDAGVEAGFIMAVSDLPAATAINQTAAKLRRKAHIQIKLDSGMGRFGFNLDTALDAVHAIAKMPHLERHGIFSHFAAAETTDSATMAQLHGVKDVLGQLEKDQIGFKYRHIANSNAIASIPEAYAAPFNMVRAGIDLHGGQVCNTLPADILPVYTLKARLVSVRCLAAGTSISYGRTYTVTQPQGERIGIVSIGYADGYPRSLSNVGEMLVRGCRCPVRGTVCMDYTMLSLEHAPAAAVGDEVVVIGSQGNETLTVAEVAQAAGTISYELMCGLGPRVQRFYRDGARS